MEDKQEARRWRGWRVLDTTGRMSTDHHACQMVTMTAAHEELSPNSNQTIDYNVHLINRARGGTCHLGFFLFLPLILGIIHGDSNSFIYAICYIFLLYSKVLEHEFQVFPDKNHYYTSQLKTGELFQNWTSFTMGWRASWNLRVITIRWYTFNGLAHISISQRKLNLQSNSAIRNEQDQALNVDY